jgi:hypothetical protein
MDYVFEFACKEYEEMQEKAKQGKMTMADMQYADLLMHYKKSALTAEAMEQQEGQNRAGRSYDEYSGRRSMDDRGDRYSGAYSMRSYDERGGSYRSMMDGRSERMRYSGNNGAAEHLRKAIDHTSDDEARHELMKVLEKLETNNR